MSLVMAIGRLLFVLMFVVSGVSKLFDLGDTANSIASHVLGPMSALMAPLTPYLTQVEGVTGMTTPQLAAIAVGVFEVLGGLLIAFDLGTRWISVLFVLFVAASTFFYHDFWNMTGAERVANMIHAMKNLSILGGFLLLMATSGRHGDQRMRSDEM